MQNYAEVDPEGVSGERKGLNMLQEDSQAMNKEEH
jgi:hypothetical protein